MKRQDRPLRGKGCIVCTQKNGSVLVINEHSHPDSLRGYEFDNIYIFEEVNDSEKAMAMMQAPKADVWTKDNLQTRPIL